jgi:hypothetical protein
MPQFRSGNGGYVELSADGMNWTEMDTAVWDLTEDIKDVENTHSGTGGDTNYEAVVNDNSSTVELPWDEDNPPDVVVLIGYKIFVRFKHGDGTVVKQLSNTLFKSLKTHDDNAADIVRVTMELKGGSKS